jgi:hypothetical protein
MPNTTPPADSSSLLVPIHLDAWVADSQTQQQTAIYTADYTRLPQFEGLLDPPFQSSDDSKPAPGVRLHWALPDALTHGRTPAAGGDETVFPLVPNRWLVARFNTPAGGAWQCRLWVVESDYTGGNIGTTSATLATPVTTITLTAGSLLAVNIGDELQIVSPGGTFAATVIAAAAAAQGATEITIQSFDFSTIQPSGLPSGSSIQLLASSAFLNPSSPTYMSVSNDENPTVNYNVNLASIGKSYDIASWETVAGGASGQLFLQAVGPGNISFAAYRPTARDVFSFTDTELPNEGDGNVYSFTYMVVGWYSDPQQGDPLRGVSIYDPNVWQTQDEWQAQTPEERMSTLLSFLKWSVLNSDGTTDTSPTPLSTSLYHGLVADVSWPSHIIGNPGGVDPKTVQVAIGNTSADALAALIHSEALAQAAINSDQASAWTSAGDALAQLIQATMYDLLDDYGKPGGAVLIEQQIEQAWFGSNPGGTIWEVVGSSPQASGQSATPVALTPAQAAAVNAVLASLNASQISLDENVRELQSLQAQLYQMWWKIGRANSYSVYGGWDSGPNTNPDWSSVLMPFVLTLYQPLFESAWKQYCAVGQAQSELPDPTPTDSNDPRAPDNWASTNSAWLFPDSNGNQNKLKLADLGLHLKASAAPLFYHPNDPVIMVSGLNRSQRYGEDGRYNDDGTLTCRLPGQTINGINIPNQPAIDTQLVTQGGVNLSPCASYASIPSVPTLIAEAFFVDPTNAPAIAAVIKGSDAATIQSAIQNLLDETPLANTSWTGTPPAPFAVSAWDQGWSPLFLEWSAQYYPTGQNFQFSLSDWQFDGAHYAWMGTGFDSDNVVGYQGRTLLTPHAALLFKAKIEKFLADNPNYDSTQLNQLITTVSEWDILSQTLSGLTDQLITLISQETFPPTVGTSTTVPCPAGGSTQPDLATLVGNEYHSVPIVEGTNDDAFFPVRAGFVQFQALQIVDAFGQAYGGTIYPGHGQQSVWINTEYGFQPTLGQGLGLSVAPTVPATTASAALAQLPYGSFQLPPRVVQSSRLDVSFLAGDGSGKPAVVSEDPNPICGWLLPNHLDRGIAVYDSSGILLGELLSLPAGDACDNWRPRPGDPGKNPPPACPVDIPNVALRAVVQSIAAQSQDVFADLLTTIDETLWMVDPLGGRKDQFLSVLMGRPLAVVQAELSLSLMGEPVFNQLWDMMCSNPNATDPSQCTQQKDTAGVLDVPFPVRLGSLELRNDGLIGYYLPTGDNAYKTFYAVHYPLDITAGETYLRQIVQNSPQAGTQPFQGDIFLNCDGEPITLTMLVDPRGSVHAYTGILPVVSASLPGQLIEDFIKSLQVTFRTGPIIADPGTLRIPQPAEAHGVWSWIQQTAPPSNGQAATWEQDTIVDADDQARMPDAQLQLREGWLQLSDISDSSS